MGNVDWDNVWQQASTIAYGTGTRVLLALIFGYLAVHGLSHERPYQALCGLMGVILYFGSGVMLGKIGIH